MKKKIPYLPTLYVPSTGKTKWSSLDGKYLEEFTVGSILETNKFIKEHRDTSGFKIYGNLNYVYSFIADEFPGEVDYDFKDLVVAYIDIETENPTERVIAITIAVNGEYHVLGLGDFEVKGENEIGYNFETERDLLIEFYKLWDELQPDIITGWNIRFFDIPYLYNRSRVVIGEKAAKYISPWRHVIEKKVVRMNREHDVYEPVGVSVLDYYELYQTFTFAEYESATTNSSSFIFCSS